jgi:hypothetical protein
MPEPHRDPLAHPDIADEAARRPGRSRTFYVVLAVVLVALLILVLAHLV